MANPKYWNRRCLNCTLFHCVFCYNAKYRLKLAYWFSIHYGMEALIVLFSWPFPILFTPFTSGLTIYRCTHSAFEHIWAVAWVSLQTDWKNFNYFHRFLNKYIYIIHNPIRIHFISFHMNHWEWKCHLNSRPIEAKNEGKSDESVK